jgi:hypothetical protein
MEFSDTEFAAFRKISTQLVTMAEGQVDQLATLLAFRQRVQLFEKASQVAMIAQIGAMVRTLALLLAHEAQEASERGRGDEQLTADLVGQAAVLGQSYGRLKDIRDRLGAS